MAKSQAKVIQLPSEIQKPRDPQDKKAYVKWGGAQESPFTKRDAVKGWQFEMNPEKAHNPYAHDMFARVQIDLKTMDTQWKQSQRMFGIPSKWAVSINTKDFVKYAREYPNIIIVLDVRWLNAVYTITLDRARYLIGWSRAKRHFYKNRVDDEDGNAEDSFVFDLRDLDRTNVPLKLLTNP